MPEMKPCPYCNEPSPQIGERIRRSRRVLVVACQYCGLESASNPECVEAWNKLPRKPVWTPIETPPPPMADVLFFTPHDEELGYVPFMQVSYYDSTGLNIDDAYQWQDGLRPTHWMALPDAPEDEEC